MMKHAAALLPLLVSVSATACLAHPDESSSDDALTAAPGVIYQDPPPVPPQTTLTLYSDANYTGTSYTVSLLPASPLQATRTVTEAELTQRALFGKISSVRIICGQRSSRVSLFSTNWGEFSKGTMLECAPNHSAAVNLVNVGYDNRINAAALAPSDRDVTSELDDVYGIVDLNVLRSNRIRYGGIANAVDDLPRPLPPMSERSRKICVTS